jgi:DNA end-binding protein Ku
VATRPRRHVEEVVMPRPIWTGTLSFGLLNIPISLMSGERRTDLSFRMLDSRNNAPIRYERVNAETGEEVPWKDIVKAYQYNKGSYVVLEEEDFKAAAVEHREAVEIEAFVDADEVSPVYFEKPYILVPGKKAEKGYVLLRETLKKTGKVGIARVVIRTREYLSMVMPKDDALVMLLLRFPQEVVDPGEYAIPTGDASKYRITPKEIEMAGQLIKSMAGKWKPADYKDDYRDRLHKVIEKRMKSKGLVARAPDEESLPENAATNFVDFMSLLQKSLATNKRTPARDTAATEVVKKAVRKAPAKKAAARKVPAKKAAVKRKAS